MDKNTQAQCPYFSKDDAVRIRCEGFCEEVLKITLDFKTKRQRQEYERNFCDCGCWKGCCVARMIEEKYNPPCLP